CMRQRSMPVMARPWHGPPPLRRLAHSHWLWWGHQRAPPRMGSGLRVGFSLFRSVVGFFLGWFVVGSRCCRVRAFRVRALLWGVVGVFVGLGVVGSGWWVFARLRGFWVGCWGCCGYAVRLLRA